MPAFKESISAMRFDNDLGGGGARGVENLRENLKMWSIDAQRLEVPFRPGIDDLRRQTIR